MLGDGPTDLVFYHGFCHIDLQWDVASESAFMKGLAEFSRLILFDRRGSGASDPVPGGRFPTWEEWSVDLIAVLEAAGADPRARYCYEAVTTSPAMTSPTTGGEPPIGSRVSKSQAYLGKFEDEDGARLHGADRYVIRINGPVPAELFWSVVIYDADTRCVIDNRHGAVGGKATVGSRTPGLRQNDDGSYSMLLSPDPPPPGWEANHVQTLPGRGWFPYFRAYGAETSFFDGTYTYPTVNRVSDFDHLG